MILEEEDLKKKTDGKEFNCLGNEYETLSKELLAYIKVLSNRHTHSIMHFYKGPIYEQLSHSLLVLIGSKTVKIR